MTAESPLPLKSGSAARTTPPAVISRPGWHGIDFHILMTLLFRGASILGGTTTVLIVPFCLDSVEQGYYYTFVSILGLHIFFELGLSQVVIQLVGHDVAHLRIAGRHLDGDPVRIDRVTSLLQLLRRWYAVAGVLFWVVGGAAGALFFHLRGELAPAAWLPVWVVLVTATAVNLSYTPALALLEGTGKVGQVARLRLVQSAAGYGCLWLVLLGGGGLWAAIALPVISAAATAWWVRHEGGLYQSLARRPFNPRNRIDWKREMLPFQWRIAASWMSGYFIFHAFTPLIFMHQGAVEAGRFGIAMTVFSSLSAIGMSWVNAKAANFGMLVSRGQRSELNELFVGVFGRSIGFTAVLCVGTVLIALLLTSAQVPVMARVASPGVLAGLAAVCVLNCVVFSVATYMRAHREEPMLPVSIVAGVGTALIAYAGSMHSVHLMTAAYLLLNALIVLPWSLRLFSRYFHRAT